MTGDTSRSNGTLNSVLPGQNFSTSPKRCAVLISSFRMQQSKRASLISKPESSTRKGSGKFPHYTTAMVEAVEKS